MKYLTQKGLRILNEIKAPSIRGTLAAAAARVGTKAINSSPKVSGRQDSPPAPRRVPGTKKEAPERPGYQKLRRDGTPLKGGGMLGINNPDVDAYEKRPKSGGPFLRLARIGDKEEPVSPWGALNKAPGGMAGGSTMHRDNRSGGEKFMGGWMFPPAQNFPGGRPQTWSAERKEGFPGRHASDSLVGRGGLALGRKGSRYPAQTTTAQPQFQTQKGRMRMGDREAGLTMRGDDDPGFTKYSKGWSTHGRQKDGRVVPGPYYQARTHDADNIMRRQMHDTDWKAQGLKQPPWESDASFEARKKAGKSSADRTKAEQQRDKDNQRDWDASYSPYRKYVKDPKEAQRMKDLAKRMKGMNAAAKKSKIEREGPGIKFDR